MIKRAFEKKHIDAMVIYTLYNIFGNLSQHFCLPLIFYRKEMDLIILLSLATIAMRRDC